MPYSVIDLYRKVLPRTNCRDCGYATCLAFAGMVVSEGVPLGTCPYVEEPLRKEVQEALDAQRRAGKWTRRDPAADALQWARSRATSMNIVDLPERIGGQLIEKEGRQALLLPYFTERILVFPDHVEKEGGDPLNRWEQVLVYNHVAQGGIRKPVGLWKGFQELPNTVSKVKTMKANVEGPLIARFRHGTEKLLGSGLALGAESLEAHASGADVALLFRPLPRIPVLLLFWDEDPSEAYDADMKLMFDETIVEHLDIESILFLSERLKQRLLGE